MPEVSTRSPITVIVHADHRNSICDKCKVQMEIKEVTYKGMPKDMAVCPQCGGLGKDVGQLIARPISIQPPPPPSCISFRCLWRFIIDSLFSAFLSSYHYRRVAYAEANRPEKKMILERYRTGSPAPTTLWGALHANIKLRCPICRKYNIDPFLLRR